MSSFRILSDKSSGVSKHREDNGHEQTELNVLSLFESDSESGNSDTEKKPVTRTITSAREVRPQSTSTAAPVHVTATKQEKVEETAPKEDVKKIEKASQIARLVERRRIAERELEIKFEGEVRDETLFRYDVDKCPEHVDVVQYEQTPVDGFGETMLRAMGWKGKLTDGKGEGPKLRPARLGLGAKLGGPPPPSRKATGKRERSLEKGMNGESAKEMLKGFDSADESSGLHEYSRQKTTSKVYGRPSTERNSIDKAQEKGSADLEYGELDGSNGRRKANHMHDDDEMPYTVNGGSKENWIRGRTADQYALHSWTGEGLVDTNRHHFRGLDEQEERFWDHNAGRRDERPAYARAREVERWNHDNRRQTESQLVTENERWRIRTMHKEEDSQGHGARRRQRRSRFSDARVELMGTDSYDARERCGPVRDTKTRRF